MFDNEMRKLTQYYNQFCNARIISESKNSSNAAAQAGLRAGEEPGGALDAGNMPSREAYRSTENRTGSESVSSDKTDPVSGASTDVDAEVPFESAVDVPVESAVDVAVEALADSETTSESQELAANF